MVKGILRDLQYHLQTGQYPQFLQYLLKTGQYQKLICPLRSDLHETQ